MFKKEYQGGPYVDVFSTQGRDPAAHWKLNGAVRKEFDKVVRGYVYALEGGASTTTTRMTLPKSDKTSLCLLQPCCVLQLMVPDAAKLTVDLTVLDDGGIRRRINLSSSQRELSATPLNARLPLGDLITGQWVNLCVGVASLVESLFKGSQFKSLEGISLGGSCKLRRIFTLQSTPTSVDEAEASTWASLPKSFHITSVPTKTQIVSFKTWTVLTESKLASHSDHSSSQERPTHVAFGKKVTIPDHILTARQVSQEAEDGKIGSRVQPRPPSHPADQSLLRIQRTRVRIVSGWRSGARKAKDADHRTSTRNSGFQGGTDGKPGSAISILTSDEQMAVEALQQSRISAGNDQPAERNHLAGDNRLAEEGQLAGGDQVEGRSHLAEEDQLIEEDRLTGEDWLTGEDRLLGEDRLTGEDQLAEVAEKGHLEREDHMALSNMSEEPVYSYRSAPKSAESRPTSLKESGGVQSRGARLEEDFLTPATPLDEDLGNTRLSDDYDWRQYASADDDKGHSVDDDHSLRTRLASHLPPTHSPPTLPDTVSAPFEDTLSGSMTLNGLEEHLSNMPQLSLLDSMETRAMGGMLSPALLDTGQQVIEEPDNPHNSKADELELMYDPQLNCFYDPVTCKYYELIQSD